MRKFSFWYISLYFAVDEQTCYCILSHATTLSSCSPKQGKSGKSRLVREEDEPDDVDDDPRISFTGVKSAARDRKARQEGLRESAYHSDDEEDGEEDGENDWEEMQIRKAMSKTQISEAVANVVAERQGYLAGPGTGLFSQEGTAAPKLPKLGPPMVKPAEYNLQGIKERLKKR
jgi:hypothetical protein